MRNVSDYLKQLGLSDIECKLYLGLLETGSTTVMELANHANIKRITAHFNIESLIAKGLVTETRKGARRQIVAESPGKLEQLLEDREVEISQLKLNLPTIIDSIAKSIPRVQTAEDVEVRHYEGKKAVFQVYAETFKADEVFSIVNLDKYYKIYPDTSNYFKEAFDENPNRSVWTITVDSPFAREIESDDSTSYPNYHVKYMKPKDGKLIFDFAEYLIYDNKVAIILLGEDKVTATIINSKLTFLSLKALHLYIWELLG